MPRVAYLSLGSNLGDRRQNLERAIELLEGMEVLVLRRSSVYETAPRDIEDQPWFLNMVLEVRTRLFPHQLLAVVRKIEARLGRKRIAAKGPRTIDIDIVLFGRAVIRTADLEIPHPRMSERRFVLEPLGELVPELRHPISRQSVRELLAKVGGQQGRRLDVT